MKFEYRKFWVDSAYRFDLMACLSAIGQEGWDCIHIQFEILPNFKRSDKARFVIAKKQIK